MSFPARFPGRCAACDERIREGDQIRMTEDGAIHDDCTDTAPVERFETVCGVCWLTHPAGACDR